MPLVLRRDALLVPLALAGAAVLGALVAVKPTAAVFLVGAAALVVLTFGFPVTHFVLLMVATVIVPYELQNQYGIGGGTGAAGLVISDVLLLSGAARGVYALAASRRRLSTGEIVALLGLVAYLALTTVQFARGAFFEGFGLSQAGDEWRSLNGVAALLIALPLVREPEMRSTMLKGLLTVGLLLGAWGMVQWIFQLGFAGSAGIRLGVPQTSGSVSGQLQGGLYGYPVAVCLSFAALLAPGLTARGRTLVISCLVLNGMSLLLTFERTFWLTAILGLGLITLRAGRAQRLKAVIAMPLALVLIVAVAAVAFPGVFTAASQRLLSLGQSAQESSVQYRVIENRHLVVQIGNHPAAGSGLGAPMWWGRPDSGVPPTINYFAHNGPLWIWWKLGILGLIVAFGAMSLAIVRRGRALGSPVFAMISVGAQGALLALLLTNITFPSVTARTITPTIGLLLAICCLPRESYAVSAARAR